MATIEKHPRSKGSWRVVEGSKVLSAWLNYATARKFLKCWNKCENDDVDTI